MTTPARWSSEHRRLLAATIVVVLLIAAALAAVGGSSSAAPRRAHVASSSAFVRSTALLAKQAQVEQLRALTARQSAQISSLSAQLQAVRAHNRRHHKRR
jgi:cell division protein FtsB